MAIKSFEILSVPVSDPQRSKEFYRDVVGFELLREEPMGPGGLQGVMLNVTDIVRDHKELSERGLKLAEIKQEPWGRYTTFQDPDGNGWILRQPPA